MGGRVINFLFPGDIIRLNLTRGTYIKLEKEPRDYSDFKITDITFNRTSLDDVYYISLCPVSQELKESFSPITQVISSVFKLIIDISNRSRNNFIRFECCKLSNNNNELVYQYIHDFCIVYRPEYVRCSSCMDTCFLCYNNICNEDTVCEKYWKGKDRKHNLPFLGDVIKRFGNLWTVESLYYYYDSRDSYGVTVVRNKDHKKTFLSYPNDCIISEKRSLVVDRSDLPCNSCILNSCDNCELKKLKDLNIIQQYINE